MFALITQMALLGGMLVGDLDTTPSAETLEARCLAARRAIKRGEIVVKARNDRDVPEHELHFFFDGSKRRLDARQPVRRATVTAKGVAEAANFGFRVRRRVVTDDEFLAYTPESPATAAGGRYTARRVLVDNADDRQPVPQVDTADEDRLERLAVFDPRLIGMVPCDYGVLGYNHLESFVGRPDRKNCAVSKEAIDTRNVWKIEYDIEGGARARMWISPDEGYSLVRAELEAPDGDAIIKDSITCQVEHHQEADVWFPKVVLWKRHYKGEIVDEQELTVERASFNQSIDPTVFTFKGLQVPPGTVLNELPRPPGRTRVWDGLKVVPDVPDIHTGDSFLPGSSSRQRWILISLNCGALAIILLWLYFSKRAKSKHDRDLRESTHQDEGRIS
ncbi:MAG: hypothetical protein ABII12_05360 [Planctomycetota bacterium]